MAKAGGYVLHLTSDRFHIFLQSLYYDGRFAEAVPSFEHSRSAPLVCFIVNPNKQITHVARGRRGVNAGTQQSRLNIEEVEELVVPLSINDVIQGVPARNRRTVENRFRTGGLLAPQAFQKTIDLMMELAPGIRAVIDRFSTSTRQRLARLSQKVLDGLAYQKEAVAVALNLAGLDRTPLSEWRLNREGAPQSFLEGLPQARMREDPMIIQDMHQVPGYNYLKDIPNASAAVFSDGVNYLTIIMANRQPLEEQTGTDLIYYNETFKAFVMVQYKVMEPDEELGAIFRFPEKKLQEEIKRMDDLLSELEKSGNDVTTNGFRLNSNPFFIKFCPRIQFEPDTTGLTKGMYIHHSYWKLLEADDRLKGPKGGRRLAYSNVGRYFDNSSFVSIVRGAWVGTTIIQSELLEIWMQSIIEAGRSITFAVKTDGPEPEGEKLREHDPNPDLGLVVEERERLTVKVMRG